MKKYLLLAIIVFCSYISFSQQLLIQSNSKGLFLNHTISAKENFFAVGRMYGVSPKDIATFNGIDMNKGLIAGQTIMIPLNATNFSQATAKGIPVFYTVGQKEGLYRVSLKNNKVLMANLRKWNKLANDNITTGQKLVVGYLNTTETPPPSDVARVEAPVKTGVAPAKEEEKKEAPQSINPVAEKKSEPISEPQQSNTVASTAPANTSRQSASGVGYFKSQFDLQSRKNASNKDQTVTTGIFKTTSGWQDSKYYALMDNIEPGTIIRVVNPSNNKSIYAKILGEMSGIRQNQGLELRLSNAAASALEVSQMDKFVVRINY